MNKNGSNQRSLVAMVQGIRYVTINTVKVEVVFSSVQITPTTPK